MSLHLLAPLPNATVSLYTDAQRTFRTEEERRRTMDGALTFTWYALEDTGSDRTIPAPVHFAFSDEEEDGHYLLLVSEWEDMRDPIFVFTDEKETDLYNLKVGTRYYWCVQKDGVRSESACFFTACDLPRCVRIDGVPNARDMGGYPAFEGRIRQGLLFRGSEFETHAHLSAVGAEDLRTLGIRTDLDLRGEAKDKVLFPTSSLLGLRYVLLPTLPYGALFEKKNRKNTRRFFLELTHRRAYPIYFHCWGGADRTGTLAFLLGAFLGMTKEALIYEYEFTSLSRWGTRSRNYPPMAEFIRAFESFSGDTYREKARTFFTVHLGLSDKHLRAIEDILIEKNA